MSLMETIRRRRLFFDGAMGTLLQEEGLKAGELPELWNLTHPDVVEAIHRQYLDAGCNLLKTNTFGANRLKLAGCGYRVEEIVASAVSHARHAAKGYLQPVFVGMDIGPTGKLLKPLGDLSFEQAYDVFAQMARAGEQAGADFILIETMGDTYEVKAALLAAKECTSLPVFVTMVFDERGKLLTGGSIEAAVALLEGLGADAIGFNCGLGPVQMRELLPILLKTASVPVILNPNAGLPRSENGKTVYDIGPDEFGELMKPLVECGVHIVGGCCGTTPAHLQQLIANCKELPQSPVVPKEDTLVSSYSHAVRLGGKPVMIGERINPTGKKRLKQALRENDMDYLLREAISEQQHGAQILDVNVGLPEIDEPAVMEQAVQEIQGVTDLPLQIDTSDPVAMERALRAYNGKAMINSVNGKEESMRTVFPLAKKYGGVVVGLTLDESGIPETAEGRVAIARKIIQTAAEYGIPKKDIVIDALALTISSSPDAALVTLETLSRVRKELGVGTVLGVSNVSFGLPSREIVNTAFFTLAMQQGLSAGIINPSNASMTNAYYAYCALAGYDEQCADYITHCSGRTAGTPVPAPSQEMNLFDAIVNGLSERSFSLAKEQLKQQQPLEIISQNLIPALDVVGKRFEEGTLFLPQLLMSAQAAQSAFEAVKVAMGSAEKTVQEEKIVLATVKGDIHDIGKNIVKVLLQNYGFAVIDLGKDVDPQLIVDTVNQHQVRLVGLSALMTTTVVSMEETIRLLRKECPECKIMVGGAVLTQSYADMIGADHYSKDGMGSVHYAQQIFGKK